MKTKYTIALALVAGALALPASALAAYPVVTTGGTENVTYGAATLQGTVNPRGGETDYYFQYGTNAAYGAQTALTPAGHGNAAVAVTGSVTGLQAATKYHYRLVAIGASGTARGKDRTFSTPAVPLALNIAGNPSTDIIGSPFVVVGRLTGTGAANANVVLQYNPFPYTAGFSTLGNALVTDANGAFSFPVLGLLLNAQLRVATTGNPPVYSPTILENVAVKVTLGVQRLRRRGQLRLFGQITPPEPGVRVVFQKLRPKGYSQVGRASVSAKAGSSRFSGVVHLARGGVLRAFVNLAGIDGAHVSNYSPAILVRLKRG